MLPFELTKDTPYLALSGELWSVFYEYFNRNWSCYKGFPLYIQPAWCHTPSWPRNIYNHFCGGTYQPYAGIRIVFDTGICNSLSFPNKPTQGMWLIHGSKQQNENQCEALNTLLGV